LRSDKKALPTPPLNVRGITANLFQNPPLKIRGERRVMKQSPDLRENLWKNWTIAASKAGVLRTL
jgi:hypothetical protein